MKRTSDNEGQHDRAAPRPMGPLSRDLVMMSALSVLSLICLSLIFPPRGVWPLTLVALVPWTLAVCRVQRPWVIHWGSFVFGWLFYDWLCRSPLGRNDVVLGLLGFSYVVAASWAFASVFSGRGALIHTGALMATIMTANVFFNIMPGQRKV
ncbi:MAG: urate hydroxylase PuuD, partial [Planctomycetes bacterium]|nr:urate hydroxylase PuuD [Planctomycetota bacterium]